MTGPQHYREAERVRAAAMSEDRAAQEGFSNWPRRELIALAQFHASMAQVAATLESVVTSYLGDRSTARAWAEVA